MIGSLRRQIEILTPERTPDDGGGAAVSWSVTARPWARVERLPSTRDYAGDREALLARVAVTIRYRAGLATNARVRIGALEYDVVSIEDEARHRLTLICEEAVK